MKKRVEITIALLLLVCLLVSSLPVTAVPLEEVPVVGEAADESPQEQAVRYQPGEDCRVLRHVDKDVFDAGKHVDRLPAEEELNSYVFLNEDGSRTVYFMDENVKFRDDDGIVREKNLTLTAASGGYETAQNDVRLTLPDDPASGIRLSHGDKALSLIPQGGTLSGTPEVTEDSVTYRDYYGEGISLRYTPTLSGVKEDILLDSYTGVSSFTFLLNTGGLTLYQADGQYFLAETKTAEDRVELGEIVAFDAHGRFSLGTMTVETVMPGQSYRLTVTADEAFLTDESTAYPVSIDPTMEFTGTVSIEDVTIYSGAPTTNGDWTYLHAGYYNSTYKVARTLVRLPGVTGSSPYSSATAFNITSVKFYIKEATGTSGVAVGLYANTGDSWGESSVTWNNSGHEVGTQYATASPANGIFAAYDITTLVKAWQSGTENASLGFILKSSNETSVDKAFYASEYSTTANRPYVVMTYTYTSGSINKTALVLDEGTTGTLTVSNAPGTVTWTSSNPTVATVSSSGVVTGVRVGMATITANVGANYTPLTCRVAVTLQDGVYTLKNSSANLYLGTSGATADGTSAAVYSQALTGLAGHQQRWKIKYLGSGYYSIRPMNKLNMALHATGSNADITAIGTTDSLSAIPEANRWTVAYTSNGYVFKNAGSLDKSLRTANGAASPGLSVTVGTYSASTDQFHWDMELLECVFLYNRTTQVPYTRAPVKEIELGQTYTLASLNMMVVVSGAPGNNQTVAWASGDTSVAMTTWNASSGSVTGVGQGDEVYIYIAKTINSTDYHVRFKVSVYETVYVKNLYDRTIEGDTAIINNISGAVDFLNVIYQDDFNLIFKMDGAPTRYSEAGVEVCPYHENQPCNDYDSSICPEGCLNHHKNFYRIADQLYEKFFEPNHIVVMWSNCEKEIFCKNYGDSHVPASDYAVTTRSRVGDNNFMPIIQFLTINKHLIPGEEYGDIAYMCTILAHEVVHTLGMSDNYSAKEHMEDVSCIMENPENENRNTLYDGINSGDSAFCEACLKKLEGVIPSDAFES